MNLVDRVKNILLKPQLEWEVIKNEKYTIKELYTSYAVILAAIPAVASFIGLKAIGISTGFESFALPFVMSLKYAVLTYVLSLAGAYLLALIMDLLAPTFGSTKNIEESMKVVIFAYTASWVGGIFHLIPAFSILASLAGIYSLVLLYLGMQKIKQVPRDQMAGYFIVTLLAAVIVVVITSVIISSVVFTFSTGFGTYF